MEQFWAENLGGAWRAKLSIHTPKPKLRCPSPQNAHPGKPPANQQGISGLVVEYIVAIDVTRVRFPADAFFAKCLFQDILAPRTQFWLLRTTLGIWGNGKSRANVTVAILAQGTSWAVAVTQAFLIMGSSPGAVKTLTWVPKLSSRDPRGRRRGNPRAELAIFRAPFVSNSSRD